MRTKFSTLTTCYKANAFAGTFAFLPTLEPKQKKQKSLQATAQGQCKLDTTDLRPKRSTTGNSGLAKVAVQCSADTFVVNQSLVLRINICGKNRHLRQAAKR
jgi:hypothetical protein